MPSKELRFALCNCGKPVYENCIFCLPCLQAQQKQYHRYSLPMRPAAQLTPPPSQPGSPRRSMEVSASPMTLPIRPGRPSDASEAITRAFSQESDGSHLFPPSMYRAPMRSSSRNSSNASSRRPSDSPSRPSSRTLTPADRTSTKTSRSSTPDARLRDPDYAPMAAGFARLSMKDSNGSSEHLSRPGSARPSLELEARMFSGPA